MNGQEYPEVGYEENGYRWTGDDWEPATAPLPVVDLDSHKGDVSTTAALGKREGQAISDLASPHTDGQDSKAASPDVAGSRRRGRRAASTPPPPPEVGTVYNGFRWDGHTWVPDTPVRPNLSNEARVQATAVFEAQRTAQSLGSSRKRNRGPLVILGVAIFALAGASLLLMGKLASQGAKTDSANVQRPPTEPAQQPPQPTPPARVRSTPPPEPDATTTMADPSPGQSGQQPPPGVQPTAGPAQTTAGGVQPQPGQPGGAQQPPGEQSQQGGQPSVASKPTDIPPPAPAAGRVGQPLTVGSTQWIVTSTRPGLAVPGGIQPTGQWLVADMVVTNFGSAPISLTASSYSVVTSDGQTLSAHAQAMTNSRSRLVGQVVSGKSATGTVYFDVPKNVTAKSLTLSISGAGKLTVQV